MKLGDFVYFAPNLPFAMLDLGGGHKLPGQYRARIEGYYLQPATVCVTQGHAFAAGLLALAAIDAMSKLYFGPNRKGRRVGNDFRNFVRLLLPSFAQESAASVLYEKYRNGLVHEARLKDGCQFQLGLPATLDLSGPVPVIDPERLLAEVHSAMRRLVDEMAASKAFRLEFVKLLRREFRYELSDAT